MIPPRLVASVIATLVGLMVPHVAFANETPPIFGVTGATTTSALVWRFDRSSGRLSTSNFYEPGRSASEWRYLVSDRCVDENDCGASTFTCPSMAGLPGRMYTSLAYRIGPNGTAVGSTRIANVCVYPDRSVPLAVVKAAVHEEVRKRIPSPTVVSAPPGVSLVNLLTIFSTTPAAEQVISFTVPVPGEVRAVPEYTWDFGDGIQGVGPGRPFTSSVLPSANPGYYTGATYSRPGMKHVTLTVTWRVTFRLEGVQDIPLDPIVMMASEDKQITTARAVLVN